MPVRVVPIASCQREAFCLFQYILLDLSLDGIRLDESRFLNGSRTAHCESLKRLRHKRSLFLGLFPNYTSLSLVSPVTLFTRQKLLFGWCGRVSGRLRTKSLAIPLRRQVEGRTFFEMESFQHFLVNMNIAFHFFLNILLKLKKCRQFIFACIRTSSLTNLL